MSQSDCDVDGGAHSALTAAVLKVGMPPCPHRKVQRDASAKRPRSRVQRASEAPDGDTTTYPGTMPVAFALGAGCRLLPIAEGRKTLRLRQDARGCNGHRRRRMVRQQPTRVRCPSRFARKPRLRAIAFLEVQLEIWWCGYVTVRHDSEVKGSRDSGPRI